MLKSMHEVELDSTTTNFEWPADTVLLEAMEAAGVDAPHSCRMGECGACRCVVEGGDSYMKHNNVLDEAEMEDGYRLACQTLRTEEGPYSISYDCW